MTKRGDEYLPLVGDSPSQVDRAKNSLGKQTKPCYIPCISHWSLMRITQSLFDRLLPSLPDGKITGIHIGLYWTAVTAEVDGDVRCGLAATVSDEDHHYTSEPAVPRAGRLLDLSARELTGLVHSAYLPEVSVGLAAVNALLPRLSDLWVNLHSKEV